MQSTESLIAGQDLVTEQQEYFLYYVTFMTIKKH